MRHFTLVARRVENKGRMFDRNGEDNNGETYEHNKGVLKEIGWADVEKSR